MQFAFFGHAEKTLKNMMMMIRCPKKFQTFPFHCLFKEDSLSFSYSINHCVVSPASSITSKGKRKKKNVNLFNSMHICLFQLKHCGKQVYEVLLPLVKSIEPEQNRHLRNLIDKLDPACYNTSVSFIVVLNFCP